MQTKEEVYKMAYDEWLSKLSEPNNTAIKYDSIECSIEEAAHKYATDEVLWWERRNAGPLVIKCCKNFGRALGEGLFNWKYPSTIYLKDIVLVGNEGEKDSFVFPHLVIDYCPYCGIQISPISESEFHDRRKQWENIFAISDSHVNPIAPEPYKKYTKPEIDDKQLE